MYHHLTYEQRCQIYVLLKRNVSQKEITRTIGITQSTISRELSKNKGKRGYRHKQAHNNAIIRRISANRRLKKIDESLSLLLDNFLCKYQWSPEQIGGYLKKQGIFVSHETIYKYIWNDKRNGGNLYKQLRNRGKKYNKRANKSAGRGLIPHRIGIEYRPAIVDKKVRVGDFEIDTIVGSRHRGAIVSIVDRKTMITRLGLLGRATADKTSCAVVKLLRPIKRHVHTITSDNGKEFAKHRAIAKKLKAKFYFARPYHAWERGLNENTNRLVRQYFPKGTDFTIISQKDVKNVEYLLNTRPRKSLNFNTPIEVFYQHTNHLLKYALRP